MFKDQNGGRQHDSGGGHPPHPQRRVHVLPVPQHHGGRLRPQQGAAFAVRRIEKCTTRSDTVSLCYISDASVVSETQILMCRLLSANKAFLNEGFL